MEDIGMAWLVLVNNWNTVVRLLDILHFHHGKSLMDSKN